MWYVLRCRTGDEDTILSSCRQHMTKEVLNDVFCFTYERMKKYCGGWHTETLQMFPDYIFLETEKEEELSEALEQYREIVQVLEDKEILWRVYPDEEQFLRGLCGQHHHLRMSKGYIRDGVTYVTDGPLMGMEQRIQKIDRHKRIARLDVPMKLAASSIWAGLEIVEKS